MLTLTRELPLNRRLMLVGCAAAAAGISIYGPMMNWVGHAPALWRGRLRQPNLRLGSCSRSRLQGSQALVPKTSVPEVA